MNELSAIFKRRTQKHGFILLNKRNAFECLSFETAEKVNVVLGMMGPFYAHLYRDPVPGKILKMRAPRVVEWIERCCSLTNFKEQ